MQIHSQTVTSHIAVAIRNKRTYFQHSLKSHGILVSQSYQHFNKQNKTQSSCCPKSQYNQSQKLIYIIKLHLFTILCNKISPMTQCPTDSKLVDF